MTRFKPSRPPGQPPRKRPLKKRERHTATAAIEALPSAKILPFRPQMEEARLEAPRGYFTPLERTFIRDVAAVLSISPNYPPELFSVFLNDWRPVFQRLETGLGLKQVGDMFVTENSPLYNN
jgi:hypothetical protein